MRIRPCWLFARQNQRFEFSARGFVASVCLCRSQLGGARARNHRLVERYKMLRTLGRGDERCRSAMTQRDENLILMDILYVNHIRELVGYPENSSERIDYEAKYVF